MHEELKDVSEHLRELGLGSLAHAQQHTFFDSMDRQGYQTIMNEALREYLNKVKQPLDEETLRRIIQEELRAVK